MKKSSMFILTTFVLASLYPKVTLALETVLLKPKKIFTPVGFDDNDNTQVVLYGYLPNLCYKSPRTKVFVSGKEVSILFTAIKGNEKAPCVQMVVPVTEIVDLGVLAQGNYNITVNGGTAAESRSKIQVSRALSPSEDDHIYANIESIERRPESRTVILRGYNPSDCYQPDRIEWISNEKDVLAVLPIMKKVHEVCPRKMVPFEQSLEVPETLSNGNSEILLHFRVMNGKSINHVFLENLNK